MADIELEELEDKIKDLGGLADRASFLVNDGDRSPLFLRAVHIFQQNAAGEMVFNVPSDCDFYGRRLNLFLSQRIVAYPASPQVVVSELTYRPAEWTVAGTSTTNAFGNGILSTIAANCSFEIRDSVRGNYQNAPLSVLSAFSARNVQPDAVYGSTAYLGGLDFHVDYFLRRGTTMTVRITPLASTRTVESTISFDEYRVTGVLQGYKKVRAFK